jgi:hypothetical protein
MSDDTDMFVYGCPTVLRNISLLNHSVMSYNMSEILKILSLTQHEFKMMCVISGTDYSQQNSETAGQASGSGTTYICPEAAYKKLIKFKSLTPKETNLYHESGGGFYDWYASQQISPPPPLHKQVSAITYISNEAMFDISSKSDNQYKQLVILNRNNIQRKRIVEIMMKEDFIFIEPEPSDEVIIRSLSSENGSLSSSPVYGIEQSPDKHANFIGNQVYGVNVSSFHELHTSFSKSKSKKIPRPK